MKKTTITPNRFITYTQSWWAKCAYILSFLVILFSCEEDLNLLGFSNQERFKVYYAEIPVESSVLWMDSLPNLSITNSDPKNLTRVMVGKYVDPMFGTIEAKTFAQFRPTSFPVKKNGDLFDSLVLQFRYDFYTYGASSTSDVTFKVHEITQSIDPNSRYFSNTQIAYNPNSIGDTTIEINADYFKKEFEDTDADSVAITRIKLHKSYGERLFDAANGADSLFTNVEFFIDRFKGLALVSEDADKIIGINNNLNDQTALILYFHEGDVKKNISFSLSNLIAFSQISANRAGTELDGLNAFHSDFMPPNNRHIQNGTSIITKLDLSKYYEYMDTIPNIIINSAEFSINNVESASEYAAPQNLSLAMLREDNRYKALKNPPTDTKSQAYLDYIKTQDYVEYLSFGGFANDAKLFAISDGGSLFTLPHSETNKTYLGYPTLFFQKLFDLKQNKYPFWALLPSAPPAGKAVNRTVFQKDNIKLKIYYTRPLLNEN